MLGWLLDRPAIAQNRRLKAQLRETKLFAQRAFAEEAARKWFDDQSQTPPSVFAQKPSELAATYRRLLTKPPTNIFEIGIKNGGSLVLWKTLFPSAKITGMDLVLGRASREEGITYVKGDQGDINLLSAIAAEHGPFDLVIDDGSHLVEHQLAGVKTLFHHIMPGGIYLIEDVHASIKQKGEERYGKDIWPEFVTVLLAHLRGNAVRVTADSPSHVRLAAEIAPKIADVIISFHTLALRTADRL